MEAVTALVMTGVLFAWFNHLERVGRAVIVVAILFGLLLAECVIYQSQNLIPTSIIHPEYKGQPFRLVDLVIPAAVLARLIQRPRATPGTMPWFAFLAWLATAALVGAYNDNSLHLVFFHAKVIIYLGALFVAAGVPRSEYLAGRRLEHFVVAVASVAAAMFAFGLSGVRITAGLPLLPLDGFGELGSDAATVFTSVGVVALAVGLLADERRGRLLASALVLFVTPVAADQRAAFVALGASLVIVVVAASLSHRRVRITPTEAGLAVLAVVAMLLVTTLPEVLSGRVVKLPLQDRITTTFGSYEETLTTTERVNQLKQVKVLVADKPIFGHGLGAQFVYYQTGFRKFVISDIAHDIIADLALRTGLVGVALFLFALAGLARRLALAWTRLDDRAAAFALGLGALLAGLLAKGLAESIFEKYRLAALLGLAIGTAVAAGASPAPAPAAQGAARTRTDVTVPLRVREPA